MKINKFIILVFSLIAFPSAIYSYPIPFQPLGKLCKESDLIVIGKVGENKLDLSGSKEKIELNVASILKGKVNQQIIYVYTYSGGMCPEPPRYRNGEVVLAFLSSADSEEKNVYRTVGLSYGKKVLTDAALAVYKERIYEI